MTLDNFPTTRPSFTANFARSQQMPPQVTFSRASTGTYVGENGLIQTTTNNTPRFDWENGKCQGLLIEQSRTNLLLQSEDFTTTWVSTNAALTANANTAPDGSNTATRLSTSTGTWPTYISQPFGPSGTVKTFSVYARADTGTDWIAIGGIQYGGELAYFNLSTGTIGTVQGQLTNTQIDFIGNGWYRCACTCDFGSASGGAGGFGGVIPVTGDNTLNIVASGTGPLIWGAQLEQSSYLTSYIPTTGSEATRARDVAQINNLDFWSDKATLTAEYEVQNVGGYAFQWGFDQGTGAGGIQANPGNIPGLLYIIGTGDPAYLRGNDNFWVTGRPLKAAYSWDCSAGSYSGFVDVGTATPITQTGFAIAAPRTRFTFGAWGNDQRNSTVWSYMAYYPTRASHDVLEALTQ